MNGAIIYFSQPPLLDARFEKNEVKSTHTRSEVMHRDEFVSREFITQLVPCLALILSFIVYRREAGSILKIFGSDVFSLFVYWT